MKRYAQITRKIPREIVLLKGLPCVWSRCTFCDYIDDNSTDHALIQRIAEKELTKVTGRFGRLEVINSGSIQELTEPVLEKIRETIGRTGITELVCESYWAYRHRFEETKRFFGVPTRIKIGVETFDRELRNEVLNKNMHFESPSEVAALTDTICLLIGFKGQTHDTIRKDIDILLEYFTYGCVNLFTPNTKSAGLIDNSIKEWFCREYAGLDEHPTIEVLWENTEFGVG